MRRLMLGVAAFLTLMSARANATCTTFPTTLTNGTTTDATQVMGNFNYLSGCLAPIASPSFTGSVGVGTTSPLTTLDVAKGTAGITFTPNARTTEIIESSNSSGTALSIISPTSGVSAIFLGNQTTEAIGQIQYNQTSGNLSLITDGGLGVLALTSAGKVGIGTSTPSQQLVVTGNADVTGANGYLTEIANATTTGTTVNKLAKLTGAPSTAVISATTDTDGIVGVVVGSTGSSGTTGNAQIAFAGQAACTFENATTAGDFVTIGSTTAGDCHDAGATRPSSGQTLGRVLASVSSGSAATVLLFIR